MGRIKNSIPDYIDINDSEDLESYAFRQELNDYIEAGEFQDNSLLREFLEDILPHKGPNHFIMISDKDGRTKNIAYTRQRKNHYIYPNLLPTSESYITTSFISELYKSKKFSKCDLRTFFQREKSLPALGFSQKMGLYAGGVLQYRPLR